MDASTDLSKLLPAEKVFLSLCATGDRIKIGSAEMPEENDKDVEIRAELLRALLLNQYEGATLSEKGLRLRGARITGRLDLQGVDCSHDITLSRCDIENAPVFVNARMRGLYLGGSHCPGLKADGAVFEGSVYLRNGFVATRELSMPGVRIANDLQIVDATLNGVGRASLFAPSLRVDGSVYLGDYPYDEVESELHAEGALFLLSAQVKQDFYCKNCALTPQQAETRQAITLDGEAGNRPSALCLARAEIGGVLYLKENQIYQGSVNLSDATVRRLNDDAGDEMAAYRIRLDGLDYREFAQDADTGLAARLRWLDRRPEHVEFSAQPYEHLARVLNRIGHREDAQQVLIRKEVNQRAANLDAIRQSGQQTWKIPFLRLRDAVLFWMVGYGYRPTLAMVWGVILIAGLSVFFQLTWKAGDFAPNAAPILVSKDWIAATQSHPDNPAEFWASRGQAGQDYETFNAIAYSADLVIPIVNLGQEDAWAPSTSRSPLGQVAWSVRWYAKIIGWIVTALAAAALTGLIRRD